MKRSGEKCTYDNTCDCGYFPPCVREEIEDEEDL